MRLLPGWAPGWRQHEAALTALLAVEGPRSPENTLRLYDAAIEQLNLAGAQAGVLNSVAPDKGVRDQAQIEAQRVAMAGSALSLNREVYEALVAIELEGASPATRHFVERTLLSYRLAGVDKDQATRDRLQALQEKATRLSLEFSRNIQEGGKDDTKPRQTNWTACPRTTWHAIRPTQRDRSTISTDQPDMQPVMTFAASAALRERMFLAYNTRAYPANKQILLDLLATRQEIASVLGFRSWADLATADQMMGSAANVREFPGQAGRGQPRRRAATSTNWSWSLRASGSRSLQAIDITSRGYWYEQFRRSAFDFDSQSVRPYFPYEQVEAGVLETAARLFKVEFRPSLASGVAPLRFRSSTSSMKAAHVGRFYLDMHPREGKDKWFSAAPVVTGVRGRTCPRLR